MVRTSVLRRVRFGAVAAASLAIGASLVGGVPATQAATQAATRAATQTATPAAAPVAAAVPTVAWVPCRDGFECATVRVPLDYDRPHGKKISLSLIRLPAGDSQRRVGSLFVNPGGPGGSGVDIVRGLGKFLPLELRARFDIVGFDPRGIIRSTPLRCFRTFDEAVSIFTPFAFPVTDREERIWQQSDRALARACAQRGGEILDHMSTANVARDMDLLRRAVGDARLTYLGYSYGSYLGVTYANLFPGKVRALVVDGVLDPIAWSTGYGNQGRTVPVTTRLGSGVGSQRTLEQFLRLCNQAGPYCAFSGRAERRYDRLAARLLREPIVIGEGADSFPFTYADLIASTIGVLYAPVVWPDYAAFLAEIEAAAAPSQLASRLAAVRAGLGLDAQPQEDYPNFVEGFPGVLCSDSDNPSRFAAWSRTADATDARNFFGRPWTWFSSICQPWPGSDEDRYTGPWTARTSSPVLVVGNYFDPATRYRGALTVSRLLPRSRLLSYAGWGHVAYLAAGNFCIDAAVTRYLVSTTLPPAGTVCAPEGSPFGPLEVSARQRAATAAITPTAILPEPVRRALG